MRGMRSFRAQMSDRVTALGDTVTYDAAINPMMDAMKAAQVADLSCKSGGSGENQGFPCGTFNPWTATKGSVPLDVTAKIALGLWRSSETAFPTAAAARDYVKSAAMLWDRVLKGSPGASGMLFLDTLRGIPFDKVPWGQVPWKILDGKWGQINWSKVRNGLSGVPAVPRGIFAFSPPYDWTKAPNSAGWKLLPWFTLNWAAVPWEFIPWGKIDWSKLSLSNSPDTNADVVIAAVLKANPPAPSGSGKIKFNPNLVKGGFDLPGEAKPGDAGYTPHHNYQKKPGGAGGGFTFHANEDPGTPDDVTSSDHGAGTATPGTDVGGGETGQFCAYTGKDCAGLQVYIANLEKQLASGAFGEHASGGKLQVGLCKKQLATMGCGASPDGTGGGAAGGAGTGQASTGTTYAVTAGIGGVLGAMFGHMLGGSTEKAVLGGVIGTLLGTGAAYVATSDEKKDGTP